MIVVLQFRNKKVYSFEAFEPFLKQSVGINRQYFHQQTVIAALIVEAFSGIIGVHWAKVKKSFVWEVVLSGVEGRCRESSGVEIPGNFYYFSQMIYKDCHQELYYVYIIQCDDGSFYTGLTNDLIRRFTEHCEGAYVTCYTFKRRPLTLRYYETIPFSLEAAQREKQLKGWSRIKKIALMSGDLHKLSLLAQCQNLSHSKYKDVR